VLKRIEQLSVWQRDGVRAPHKPLLIILALSRVTRGCDRLTPFKELEKPLARLLRDYGLPRRSVHPEYPFWSLRSGGKPPFLTCKSSGGESEIGG
jgi:putative restriction endonuclease